MLTAFATTWHEQGGQVVDTLHYHSNQHLDAEIQQVLQIKDSEARANQIKKLVGYHVESVSNRRQDLDMIFLVAYPSKARQIMPLLKYYFAGDIPVFATSTVYAGNPNIARDKDLNGLVFCDSPWVFQHQQGNKNWPEQFNSYNRLYALGIDSYDLANEVSYLQQQSRDPYITRALAWGEFRQGVAQKLRLG